MLANIASVVISVLAAVGFLYLVSRTSAAPTRKESNDFTGAVVAVIGTTYAVILAFTLAGVWSMFQTAQATEEQEANALVNVYRIASEVQDVNAKPIQELCIRYVDNVMKNEWSTMEHREMTAEGGDIVNQLWSLTGEIQARARPDAIAAYQLMEELRGLTQYRRLRAMQAREALPGILWAVLIAGGVITVASSCFFGVPNFRFHILQVIVLSFLIALVLVAIADIDQPYQGVVKVAPQGFEFAARTLHHLPSP